MVALEVKRHLGKCFDALFKLLTTYFNDLIDPY